MGEKLFDLAQYHHIFFSSFFFFILLSSSIILFWSRLVTQQTYSQTRTINFTSQFYLSMRSHHKQTSSKTLVRTTPLRTTWRRCSLLGLFWNGMWKRSIYQRTWRSTLRQIGVNLSQNRGRRHQRRENWSKWGKPQHYEKYYNMKGINSTTILFIPPK